MLVRKVFRDFIENKGSYIACIIVIIIGLLVFTCFSLLSDNLSKVQEDFYFNQNFADGFIDIKSISPHRVARLEKLEGIDKVSGRVVKDVQLISSNEDKNMYLRLVSIDTEDFDPINGVKLVKGIPLDKKSTNIWLDNKFFVANNLQLNDELSIIVEGKKKNLSIVGIGQSPEFIYALRSSQEIVPSPETFGIAYVPFEVMNQFFPDNKINNIIFTLKPGYSYDDVEDNLKNELKSYGIKSMFSRKDQVSHLILNQEIEQVGNMSTAMPLLFLAIAGAILYSMLRRKIEEQRNLIGILKALGYTNEEIIFHYISYALIIGLVGGIIGGLLGLLLSYPLTDYCGEFFNIPELSGRFDLKYPFMGILLSICFSVFAGFIGCHKILKLEPAEAMNPPSPPIGRKTLFERCSFFWDGLTSQGKMAIRNLSRYKGRSFFIFFGIMICFAISGFTWSMNDMIQMMIFDQYEKVETYDIKLSLKKPKNERKVCRELNRFPGVKKVEPMLEVPITLKNLGREENVILLGLNRESVHYNILDKDYKKIIPPKNGLLLSERLAKLLDAKVGSNLVFKSEYLKNPDDKILVPIAGTIPQYLGVNAYMDINALQLLLGQKSIANNFTVSIDEDRVFSFEEIFTKSDIINSIDGLSHNYEKMKELMEITGSFIYLYSIIGMIIGFAIIYNSSIITLSERSRELATMMVLGMTLSEVISVITFEQWFLGIFAMIAGIPLSKLILLGLSQALSTDLYTIPTKITASSFIMAFLVTSISIGLAQWTAVGKVKTLSLVEVLKSRE